MIERVTGTELLDVAFDKSDNTWLTKRPTHAPTSWAESRHVKRFVNLVRNSTEHAAWLIISPSFYEIIHGQANMTYSGPGGVRRRVVSASTTDLTGEWTPLVTSAFKSSLDAFLTASGQSYWIRKAVIGSLHMQREVIQQRNHGRDLQIVSIHPLGQWNRTLRTSAFGKDNMRGSTESVYYTILEPDGNEAQVKAWWEGQGTVHKSRLRGSSRVIEGGEFEASRYLEDENILVCESTFHPPEHEGLPISLTWRFEKVATAP